MNYIYYVYSAGKHDTERVFCFDFSSLLFLKSVVHKIVQKQTNFCR